jgi:integrase
MSAFKSNSRGTYVLKRKYPAVPAIRRASGTVDSVMLERLERMCDTLYERGRHDLLEGIASGRLKPLQVYARYRTDELERLPAAEMLPPLLATFKAWAESAEGGSETRRARLKAHKRWATIPGAERMSVGELAILLKQDREGRRIGGKAKSFNDGRAAAMAFVRDTISKRHRLHTEVADVPLLKAGKRRRRVALTVPQLHDAVKAFGPGLGGMAYTMAVTGMGNTEYWGTPWHAVPPTHVVIEGSKREGRDRVVPYVCPLTTPVCAEKKFGDTLRALRTAGKIPSAVTVYSLRRTFAVIMANAGVPEARRGIYMGHSAKGMTQFYEMSQEIQDYLAEDSKRMREYLGEIGAEPQGDGMNTDCLLYVATHILLPGVIGYVFLASKARADAP